jgi:hypothetical protein
MWFGVCAAHRRQRSRAAAEYDRHVRFEVKSKDLQQLRFMVCNLQLFESEFQLKSLVWKQSVKVGDLGRQGTAVAERYRDAAPSTRHHVRVGQNDSCEGQEGGLIKRFRENWF